MLNLRRPKWLLVLALLCSASSSNADDLLYDMQIALSTYTPIYDRCPSMKFEYAAANSNQTSHLTISYISKKGPITFTIFGDAPNRDFFRLEEWIENGSLRHEFTYRGYLNADEDLNAPLWEKAPSDDPHPYLKVNLGVYPEAKKILYFQLHVSDYTPYNGNALWSEFIGTIRNCK